MEGIELGGDQQFCLRWNNFQANITSQFETLRDDEDFVDVTLACEGHRLEAHKVVLSACSPYFKELFKSNPCPHPIIFMRDCELVHVTALLEFMYAGEVNIAQAQLTAFLRTAEALQIRGLTDSSSPSKSKTESKHANQKSPPSQLRNLLSAKPSNTTSSSKAVSQNAELFNNDGDKTASSPTTQHRKLSSDDPDNDANGLHGNRNSANDNVFPTSSQMRPNNEHKEKNNYGAVRLKSDLALMERKNEDYEKKDSDGSNTTNEDDNQRTGKINPFAVGGGGYTDTEMLNNMLEPKMEMPDYASDDDMKQERAAFNSENFYDATNSLANPFASLQGSVDFMAGLNQDYTEDGIEGNGFLSPRRARQLLTRPRVPWLEQVRRVPLVGERMENTGPPRLIKLGEGVELREEQLRGVKWSDYRKLTRGLAAALFSSAELATSSVTGQRWSRAGQEARPTKPPLDRRRVQALISYVSKRFPGVEVSRIKQVLAYKCKENCAALRMRTATESTNAMLPNLPHGLGMSLGLSLMRPDTDLQQPPPPPQHPPDDDSGPGPL